MAHSPISTEARARRRWWQIATAARFPKLIRRFESPEVAHLASAFANKKGLGRCRALANLQACLEPLGAWREGANVEGAYPAAYWSCLDAADVPRLFPGQRPLTEDEQQAACIIHYVGIGKFLNGRTGLRGGWGLSCTNHCVGRFFDRAGATADLDTALVACHRNLLAASDRCAPRMLKLDGSFLVPAGDVGFFWCTALPVVAHETKRTVLHFRARSFVGKDMPSDAEVNVGRELLTMKEGDRPLAAGLLHPLVLRSAGCDA